MTNRTLNLNFKKIVFKQTNILEGKILEIIIFFFGKKV